MNAINSIVGSFVSFVVSGYTIVMMESVPSTRTLRPVLARRY